jgi:hypothetical protein
LQNASRVQEDPPQHQAPYVDHPRMDTHRDWPRTQAMAPDASQDGTQRASDEVAGGTSSHVDASSPCFGRCSRLVDAPDPSTPRASSEDSEEGDDAPGDRHYQGTDITVKGRRVGDPPLQTPWIIVVASAAKRNRLKAAHRQTESCPRRRQTFRSVTREGMTIDAPRGASQRLTLAPPNGRFRSGGCS